MGNNDLVRREAILKFVAEGKTQKEIAEILSCSQGTICYQLKDKESRKAKYNKFKQNSLDSGKTIIGRNRNFIREYLLKHPCVDCGNTDIRVLDFDHVRGTKIDNVSHCAKRCFSIEKIQEEIDKCDVRCANCHRIVTYERRLQNNN